MARSCCTMMYNPYAVGGTNDFPGAWIELYNRATNTVNLTGWTLAGGAKFAFPPGIWPPAPICR